MSLPNQAENGKTGALLPPQQVISDRPLHAKDAQYFFTASQQAIIRLIPIQVVCEMLGLKKSAVHAMVATKELPPPIKFGESRRAAARWIEQEILDLILAKAAQRAWPTVPAIDDNPAPIGSAKRANRSRRSAKFPLCTPVTESNDGVEP